MIDKHSTTPLYLQVEQFLTAQIQSGALRPGDALPSETALCQQFGIARMTARKAVDYLVRQGKVERRRGQGTFVTRDSAPLRIALPLDRHLSSSEAATGLDAPMTNRLICLERTRASDALAAQLAISAGEPLWFMKRLRLLGDVPFVFEISWMISAPFDDLSEADLNASKYAYISRKGFAVAHSEKQIRAELPSREVRDMLGLQREEPVLHATSVAWLTLGTPFEVSEIYYNQQHYLFTLTASRP
ncbi:GntR family transcriptional regulator [Cronobacter muytjensii]|uniref:GntR family transcriptional regulator n=1 Tax=Cronobacter muytjensii TaxID=413501 RepID=A0A2T7AZL3_9ENTR|nr:GntR family transcriptional regulator [Cronobacter muytjensii]KAB0883937.1 GntR family transcriptional regulator [Cronobacter muytjensii]MBF4812903.1 GntR family transcriptional regulator [Cronobacter muytjensii]PUX18149.1 GntR family transcriptional regulator [Cronobacter muytjensii]